jgi:hypothetical protein
LTERLEEMKWLTKIDELIEKIPTFWLIVFLVLGLGAAGSDILITLTGGGQQSEEVYIPKDLEDCMAELKKILPPEEIQKMREGAEEDMFLYHHGLGTWLRNNWGLWRGSRLSAWFNERGIQHPDDMSGIILTSFWRHLNGKPLGLEKQIRL